MLNVPAPTTITVAHESGETMQVTEWTVGAYTLRRFVEPNCTGWVVRATDGNLPRIHPISPGPTPDFGVSCPSKLGLIPAWAVVYAGQIMEAAQISLTFNEIIAANG